MASNAPPGYPQTNTEGYELFYALDGNKVPTLTPPSILFDGQTFPNMADLNNYKIRLEKNKLNSATEDRSVDVAGVGFPLFDNPDAQLTGWNTAPNEHMKWYMLTQAEHYALQNKGWKRAEINRHVMMHNQVGYYPEGWVGSVVQRIREPWRK